LLWLDEGNRSARPKAWLKSALVKPRRQIRPAIPEPFAGLGDDGRHVVFVALASGLQSVDVVGFDTSVPAVIADFVRESRTIQGPQIVNNAGGGENFRPRSR